MRVDVASALCFRHGCWLRGRLSIQLIVGLPIGDEGGVLFPQHEPSFSLLRKSYDCSVSRPGFKAVSQLISSFVLLFHNGECLGEYL